MTAIPAAVAHSADAPGVHLLDSVAGRGAHRAHPDLDGRAATHRQAERSGVDLEGHHRPVQAPPRSRPLQERPDLAVVRLADPHASHRHQGVDLGVAVALLVQRRQSGASGPRRTLLVVAFPITTLVIAIRSRFQRYWLNCPRMRTPPAACCSCCSGWFSFMAPWLATRGTRGNYTFSHYYLPCYAFLLVMLAGYCRAPRKASTASS